MNRGVVIMAGGSGSRLGGDVPKQYQLLAGRPVILHSLERFLRFDPQMAVVTVIASGHEKHWDLVAKNIGADVKIVLARGGESRFESVASGLELVEEGIVVGIHDAARPLVSMDTLERCYSLAFRRGSAIPVVDMDESVRILTGQEESEPLNRSRIKKVQTPQVFRSGEIKVAYREARGTGFTDDASVYESFYGKVQLVEGNRENIKITTPDDMKLAHLLMESRA